MLCNKTFFEDESVGRIKVSKAAEAYDFRNRTLGLALKYVSSGVEYYSVNHKQVEVGAGQFIILPKGVEYFAHGGDSLTTGVCVDLLGKNVRDDAFVSMLPLGIPINCRSVSALGKQMNSLCRSGSKLAGESVLQVLEEDVHRFKHEIEAIRESISPEVKKEATRAALSLKLLEVRDFLKYRYFENISLSRLEYFAGVSRYHLTRLFKASFGKTPREFQEDMRMEAARRMVVDDRMSLTELAHYLGYSDLAAFSNRFQSYWQCRPSELRRN